METTIEIAKMLIQQCPAIAALIWFLMFYVKQVEKRFTMQSEAFAAALDNVVSGLGAKIDGIENDVLEIKTVIISKQQADGGQQKTAQQL